MQNPNVIKTSTKCVLPLRHFELLVSLQTPYPVCSIILCWVMMFIVIKLCAKCYISIRVHILYTYDCTVYMMYNVHILMAVCVMRRKYAL